MAGRAAQPGRTPWDSSWPPSARIPGHGIVPRSRRGAFATTWWGRRFVDAMEAVAGQGRVARGRTYARAGQVLSLTVAPGRVGASVQGSRLTPYAVELSFDTWSADDQARLADVVAASPSLLAAVLAGLLPEGFEQACASAGLELFPASLADARFDCTCPDLGDPCKHAAAVVYLLGEWLDDEPFGVLTLRGVAREELLAHAAGRRGERRSPAGDPGDELTASADFFRRPAPFPTAPEAPAAPEIPAAPDVTAGAPTVLDLLDASLLGPGGDLVADRLRGVYATMQSLRSTDDHESG